jgi:hypothetical protein
MDRWILRTEDQSLLVTSDTVTSVSESSEPLPCVLSPSYNFRSYLTIPEDTNRDLETVKIELLKQSLPKSPENLKYQFVEVDRSDPGERQFLAVALSESKFNSIRDDDILCSEIYFLEALLAQKHCESATSFRIGFPDGILFALFDERLRWSRFVTDFKQKQVDLTEEYLRKNFSFEFQEKTIDRFDETPESRERWVRTINQLLPEPEPSSDLIGQNKGTLSRKLENPLLVLLVLLLASSLIWITHLKRVGAQLERRSQEQYRTVVGESSNSPRDDLRKKVNQLRTVRQGKNPTYPKIMTIDQHFEDIPLRILRMTFNDSETILVGLSENLETIEQFRDSLESADRVASVDIESSDSMNYDKYNFEVRLRVKWS